ncbi:hypothetical protein M422DRAFT_243242 [Sphaerobolus stellatus SS14]|nr:hypothetical protein M422DRAFT_243242 [Sphaerobolus stellatus SS14]
MLFILRLSFAAFSLLVLPLKVSASTVSSSRALDIRTSIGTFRGFQNATEGLEKWLGIPFAEPPIGTLRFRRPQAITAPFTGIMNATEFGPACPQPVSGSTVGVPVEESCLVLNIFRPSGTRSTDKLPVLAWIYGGSYNTGASSDPSFNSTFLINRSVSMGKPVIFVSLNYRVNTFGFLASSLMEEEDLNAGLQDQKAALTFVHKEIAAFGGDPDKVTIWGQSAGGGSVEAQVLYASGPSLFRAAIADSSAGPFHSAPLASDYDRPGMPYARLIDTVGCTSGSGSLQCLRNLPFEILLNASNSLIQVTLDNQLWYPAVGGPSSFVPIRASERIKSGNFPHIPMVMGTNLNDGTVFSTSVLGLPKMNASAEQERFDAFIAANIPSDITLGQEILDQLHTFYPQNDSSLGGRFNTGDSLFDRSEAWFTDQMYLSPRRFFLEKVASLQPLYGYLFDEFFPGDNPDLGVSHGSELSLIFGGAPASESSLSIAFTDAYLNFVNDLNPGPFWSRYTSENMRVLHWIKGNITMIPDDFNIDRTDFLNMPEVLAAFQK